MSGFHRAPVGIHHMDKEPANPGAPDVQVTWHQGVLPDEKPETRDVIP